MLVSDNRPPRNLKWYHAGPLLFGDWGTSRLYVLGLAFYYTAHASVLYLAAMSLIMAAIAWAYTVVCRCFPDGGGVYSAARRLSPTLAVLGATLLLCDYIVTAALSGIEAFHYLGVGESKVVIISVATIFLIGVVNWLGARNAGRMALVIAVVSIALSAVIALLCLPWLRSGISRVSLHGGGQTSPWQMWESLVRIVLALSGLEAVANMTGLMKAPVAKTAKRTIWPVLCEVVLLNLIFGIALSAMPGLKDQVEPDWVRYEIRERMAPENVPQEVKEYRDTAMRLIATETATRQFGDRTGHVFGIVTGVIFGLLLLSAVNTAVMAMVSVQYSLAQDGELPRVATRLNYSGVPWAPLVIACAAPAVLLMVVADVKSLGELYAIGVVGAISINLFSCAANRKLEIGRYERTGLWVLAGLMGAIGLTIVVAKPNATIFAGVIVSAVLVTRFFVRLRARRIAASPLPEPTLGWLAQLRDQPTVPGPGPRIMLAARGRDQAAYAVDLARRRKATLFAIYVRTLRLMDVVPGQVPKIEDDPEGQAALGTAAILAREANVPFVPIYVTSSDVVSEILDYTVTFGCDVLIMGKSQRTPFSRAVIGDVVARVAENLPEGVSLLTRAPGPFEHAEEVKPAAKAAESFSPDQES
ncbi:MAG: universal stress protein [Planctomycetes bacterium]|nr:universal stress protein [Planctomycetota bacterium]